MRGVIMGDIMPAHGLQGGGRFREVPNWVRLEAKGQLGGVVPSQKAPEVTAEQMEIARLRAENARLKMERDIAKKAAAYFAQDVLQSTLGSGK